MSKVRRTTTWAETIKLGLKISSCEQIKPLTSLLLKLKQEVLWAVCIGLSNWSQGMISKSPIVPNVGLFKREQISGLLATWY